MLILIWNGVFFLYSLRRWASPNREIGCYNNRIAVELNRHLASAAANVPVSCLMSRNETQFKFTLYVSWNNHIAKTLYRHRLDPCFGYMSDRYLSDGHWYLGKFSTARVAMWTHKIISYLLHLIAFLEFLTPEGNHAIYNNRSCSHWHHMPFDYKMFVNITAFYSCNPKPRSHLLEHPTDNITPYLLCSQLLLTIGFPGKGSLMPRMFSPWHRHVACLFRKYKIVLSVRLYADYSLGIPRRS